MKESWKEEEVVGYVKSVLQDLENGKIHIEELVISKELKKHAYQYASPTPHAVL